MKWIKHLQTKWQVSLFQCFIILLVFSLAGSAVVRLKTPILNLILPKESPLWISILTYLIVIFPLYQILLIFFGTILGQFSFFWDKEKKLFKAIVKIITR